MPIEDDSLTLTIADLCRELQVSRPTVSKLVRSPGFPVLRIGKRILIPRAGLARWIESNTTTQLND